jgi:hypothetical protein
MNILIAIPLFIIAHQNLIELNWIFNLDRILLFLLMLIQLILRLYGPLSLYVYLYTSWLFYRTASGNMGSTVYLKIMILCYTRCPN